MEPPHERARLGAQAIAGPFAAVGAVVPWQAGPRRRDRLGRGVGEVGVVSQFGLRAWQGADATELADELQLLLASLREQTPGLFEGE